MNSLAAAALANLQSGSPELQNHAFSFFTTATDIKVDWAYDVWDDLVEALGSKDNHQRAIAAQALCRLAKSDPEERILRDFDVLLDVTRDKKFVTARHTLQSLWEIGVAGPEQRKKLLQGVGARYRDCAAEKNCTLIRYDLIVGMRKLYDAVNDDEVKGFAAALIQTEGDPKYRKKYASVWKVV